MSRRIGGQNLEGQFFIIEVPDGWTEGDGLPAPQPGDRWFERRTDFMTALDCPWIRRPLRFSKWKSAELSSPPLRLVEPSTRAR